MRIPSRLALILAGLALMLPAAHSGKLSLQYNVDRRVIRACNLLVPGGYANRNPYLFIALQHSPLKPAGWEFDFEFQKHSDAAVHDVRQVFRSSFR